MKPIIPSLDALYGYRFAPPSYELQGSAGCASNRENQAVEIAAASYIPMIAMSLTVPLTPVILAASVALPVARSTL